MPLHPQIAAVTDRISVCSRRTHSPARDRRGGRHRLRLDGPGRADKGGRPETIEDRETDA
ncbi:hypothetical protein [Sphingomonas bacterium]|uniref:hypothetical protein n=1 Tax=Sphingomonas bacterium TaxID=1895847 RepID=UPI002623FC9D|nr:hypothetical protein [Sphingomonas bacterium]